MIMKMVQHHSLEGGDVRHRAVIGQIMAALVEEMTMMRNNEKMIQELLVILANHFMDKVMDVLLLHFQPTSTKINVSIIQTFASLSSQLPCHIVPFSKSIISTSLQLCKHLKQSELELKISFSDFLTKLFEAVMDYMKENEDKPDNIAVINKDQLHADVDHLYDTVFTLWLSQTKDVAAKAKYLELLSTLTPLLSEEAVLDKTTGYLMSLTSIYKKVPFFELSLSIRKLITVILTSEVLMLETILDPLLTALFQQVCITLDFTQPTSVTNQLEVLKCFNLLMKIYSEKIMSQILGKVEVSDEKTRVGALTVIRNILTLDQEVLGKKIQEIAERILTRVTTESSLRAKKVLLQIIVQLCHHGEPGNKSDRRVFLEFVVKHCGVDDTENVGRESENVLQKLSKTKDYQDILWTYVVEFILENNNLHQHTALYQSLASISQVKHDQEDGATSFNFRDLHSSVTPYKLLARFIVVSSDAGGARNQSTNILKYLQHFSSNINRHLVELWNSRIPLLVHYLENNQELDMVQWSNWLCVFISDSVNQIGSNGY